MNKQDNQQNPLYDVGSGQELRKRYGLTAENRPIIRLNANNVPAPLRRLIPYAETWGIGDDLIRSDFLEQADFQSLQRLVETIEQSDHDALYNWLAGSESHAPSEMSAEYLAFSALNMAYEEARVRLEHWEG